MLSWHYFQIHLQFFSYNSIIIIVIIIINYYSDKRPLSSLLQYRVRSHLVHSISSQCVLKNCVVQSENCTLSLSLKFPLCLGLDIKSYYLAVLINITQCSRAMLLRNLIIQFLSPLPCLSLPECLSAKEFT
jgi:hypothetical protein